ncbi:MAG: 2-amino-4-hydroxy-6-hydroxymethyldihydropteridine diphosphokinase [Bergeyella sp.]
MSQQQVLLLLGTNIGNREKNLLTAVEMLEAQVGNVQKKSEIIETKPVEFCSLNNFLNFALLINTALSPVKLLKAVKEIEHKMGRTQDSSASGYYMDRIIDIDIIKYSAIVFKCRNLEIPHSKHINERTFSRKLIENIES